MRGRSRVDHQRARIAHIGEVREQAERFDEPLAGAPVAAQIEAEHRAAAARQQAPGERVVGVRLQFGVGHRGHHGVARQEGDHAAGVLHVPRHAQRQRFDALQQLPCRHRVHARAEIAQAFAAGAQQEGRHGAFLGKHHVVEARVRLGQLRMPAGRHVIEGAAVDQHAADGGAVPAQELGGRVVEQVGTVCKRLQQPWRGEGRIDQQRHAGIVRDRRHGRDVEHVQPWVAQRLAKQQARLGADGRAPAVDVARPDKGGFDAEAAQRVVQQVVRTAVQRRRRHDMRARAHQCDDGQVQRGLARRRGDRADAVFQCRHALFEHRHGGVGEARVDVARALHVEQRGSVLAVAEDEGGGEVDRRRAGAGGRVGRGTGMQRQRVEAGFGHGRQAPNGVGTAHASTGTCWGASRANAERARFLTGFSAAFLGACACRSPSVWASIKT